MLYGPRATMDTMLWDVSFLRWVSSSCLRRLHSCQCCRRSRMVWCTRDTKMTREPCWWPWEMSSMPRHACRLYWRMKRTSSAEGDEQVSMTKSARLAGAGGRAGSRSSRGVSWYYRIDGGVLGVLVETYTTRRWTWNVIGGRKQGFAPECKSGRVSKYGYYPSQYFTRVSIRYVWSIYPAPVAKSRVSGVSGM